MTSALALACMLIVGDCRGPHVADVTRAIDGLCAQLHGGLECRAALVVTVHNETRWYLSASAMRYSPFGLTSPGMFNPAEHSIYTGAGIAWSVLRHGRQRCGTWRAAFAWYVRGEQHGRCPRVGPESRQRWREMRRLMRGRG